MQQSSFVKSNISGIKKYDTPLWIVVEQKYLKPVFEYYTWVHVLSYIAQGSHMLPAQDQGLLCSEVAPGNQSSGLKEHRNGLF